ncbi:MAG: hypothetical protein IJC45_08060 [Clostridia bacterium]|nr:hypothetical protein [Clostridia bacterium]
MKKLSIRYSKVPGFILGIYSRIPFYNMLFYRILGNEPEHYLEKFFVTSGYPQAEKQRVLKDMEKEFWLHGTHFDEYFYYDFFGKDRAYKDAFINETQRFSYYNKLNTLKGMKQFDNKWLTYGKLKPFYGREIILCRSENDRAAFVAFIEKHKKTVKKPLDSYFGNGVEIIESDEQTDRNALFDRLLADGTFLCEEYVVQHPFFADLNPSSLNTVRVPTVLTGTGPDNYEVQVFYPCLRIGRQGSVVDNAGAGGLLVQIDAQTGTLYPVARDEANHAFTAHPDSGIVFEDLTIPQWDAAVEKAKQLALSCPENRYTGWDLALTDKGWVMIEGNARAQFLVGQICDRVGKKHEMDALVKRCK